MIPGLVFLMLMMELSPAQGQDITLTGNEAILDCPGGGESQVIWKKGTKNLESKGNKTYRVKAENEMVIGEFSCEYEEVEQPDKKISHMFYLNVKVCKNCYELSNLMVTGVLLGDLLITGAVILIVYMCVPKNTDSTQQKASKPRTQSAPQVPNPDYQVLNQRTRTTDVYSALK